MDKTYAHKLVIYFGGYIIGSYLLCREALTDDRRLELKDINDIDVAIPSKRLDSVRRYLNDEGFKETEEPRKHRGYDDFKGSLLFKKEGHIALHLLTVTDSFKKEDVYSDEELIKQKFKRGNIRDLTQIIKICEKYRNKLIENKEKDENS